MDGKPTFVAAEKEDGLKMDYVYCPRGPKGRGYYHLRTKIAYVNLYSRLAASPPGGACGCLTGGKNNAALLAAWDTTKRICHERSQYSKPDDHPQAIEVDMGSLATAVVASGVAGARIG